MDERAHRVALLAHCHLNVNTKVHGLAPYTAQRSELIERLASELTGIIQLPCPEVTFLGMKRWGMTYEQYDTPAYRRHCRAILRPVLDTVAALAADGCVVQEVWGVDGSPSCGVNRTCVGYEGGEIEDLIDNGALPTVRMVARKGIFIEELRSMLGELDVEPSFHGLDERS